MCLHALLVLPCYVIGCTLHAVPVVLSSAALTSSLAMSTGHGSPATAVRAGTARCQRWSTTCRPAVITSPVNSATRYETSPLNSAARYGTSPVNYAARYGTSPVNSAARYGTSPVNSAVRYETSPLNSAAKYGTSPVNSAAKYGTSPINSAAR